jgi:membrane-associated protease RseP (regulator of RpoE activity)
MSNRWFSGPGPILFGAAGLLALAFLLAGLAGPAPAQGEKDQGKDAKKEPADPKQKEDGKAERRALPPIELPKFEDFFKDVQGLSDEQTRQLRRAFEKMRKDMEMSQKEMQRAFDNIRQPRKGVFPGGPPFGPRDMRLGLLVSPPDPLLTEQLGLNPKQGLVVDRVMPESPAARAGLKDNDILLEFNGKAVPSDAPEFRRLIAEIKTKDPVEVQVLRKGKRETIKGLTLPEPRSEQRPVPRLQPTVRRLVLSDADELRSEK